MSGSGGGEALGTTHSGKPNHGDRTSLGAAVGLAETALPHRRGAEAIDMALSHLVDDMVKMRMPAPGSYASSVAGAGVQRTGGWPMSVP
jgi:hypothetical protein